MARIGDFASIAPPVGPDTPGAEVFDRFQREADTLVIAVVDENLRPLGLIERNAFTLKMAAEFGRALYARRPASTFMDAAPRVLDADADAEILFESIDAANLGGLLNGFVVTRAGRYVGVGAGVHVLQAGSAIHKRRAEAMSELAQDLVRAEAEARASSRAKSEFLAVMSHEIRTPLNGVLGVAALMERELTQEAMRPYARTILDSGHSLLRLLTDALDMSRAEAGLMSFETAPVHIDAIAADLIALWTPRAQEKGLTLSVRCDTAGHDWVMGDEMRLKQLLNNLIGNALKFTPSGEVAVHLASAWRNGAVGLTVTVDDSGPGIDEATACTIFQPSTPARPGARGPEPAWAWPSVARSWSGCRVRLRSSDRRREGRGSASIWTCPARVRRCGAPSRLCRSRRLTKRCMSLSWTTMPPIASWPASCWSCSAARMRRPSTGARLWSGPVCGRST